MTEATAARFGLHPGSVLRLDVATMKVRVIVTAIVRPRGPASAFWTVDAAALAPSFNFPNLRAPPYWSGAVFADPGEFATMQSVFDLVTMTLQWEFPLTLGGLQADQVPAADHSLIRASGAAVPLHGDLAGATVPLTVHAELLTQLTAFTLTDTAVQQVLSLLFVSLTVVGAAVLLLAARINETRRAVELEMLRSRGASLRQLAALTLRGSGLACVPGAPAGGGLAVRLTPGPAVGLAWWLGGFTALAARASLATAAPAFALVLALTVASFSGMVRDAVTRGEVAASWQLTGGDAVVDATRVTPIVTAGVQRAVAGVPGVRRTAVAWLMSWQVPDGQIVTVVAVNPPATPPTRRASRFRLLRWPGSARRAGSYPWWRPRRRQRSSAGGPAWARSGCGWREP